MDSGYRPRREFALWHRAGKSPATNMKYAVSRFNTSIFLLYLNATGEFGSLQVQQQQQQQRDVISGDLYDIWKDNSDRRTESAEVAAHAHGGGLFRGFGKRTSEDWTAPGRIDHHQPWAKYVVISLVVESFAKCDQLSPYVGMYFWDYDGSFEGGKVYAGSSTNMTSWKSRQAN